MNDWPPPRPEPVVPASPTARAPWLRPVVQAVLVVWVLAGLATMVVIAVTSLTDNPEVTASIPTASTDGAAARPDASGATTGISADDATPTTEPQVRSAPPVPPQAIETVPPAAGTPALPTSTTIVVTLPSTTVPSGTASTGPVTIEITTRFDADGDDRTNLNDEWVRFTNVGDQSVDLTNWIVRDDGLVHAHVFAPLTLAPGAAVTVYSGCGTPTASERFFCTTNTEIWNNDGDVVLVFDDGGVLVAQVRS